MLRERGFLLDRRRHAARPAFPRPPLGATPPGSPRPASPCESTAASRRSTGAVASDRRSGTLATRSFDVSQTLNVAAKRAIAAPAVELCADGDAVIINGGTTTFQMAQFLRDRRLKVLTNSYPLAEIADPRDRVPRRACPAAKSIATRS